MCNNYFIIFYIFVENKIKRSPLTKLIIKDYFSFGENKKGLLWLIDNIICPDITTRR